MSDAPSAEATTAPRDPTDAGPTWRVDVATLRRSREDRKVAGVCGGVARTLGIDPLVLRVVLAVTAVFGAGLLVYGVGWLLIPDEGATGSEGERLLRGEADGSTAAAVVSVVLGIALFGGVFGVGGGGWIGLLVLGALVLVVASQRYGGTGHAPPAPAAEPAGYVAEPPQPPRWGPYAQPSEQAPAPVVVAPMPPAPKQPRSPLALLTLSTALLLAGGLVAGSAWSGGDGGADADIDVAAIAAGVLCVLGAGLVVGSRYGRARSLIGAALVAALVLVTAATVSVPLRGGFGERYWRPTTAAALETPYRLVGGAGELDLTAVGSAADGRDLPVTASVVAGELVVIVPADVTVVIDGHVGFGFVRTPLGLAQTGVDVDVTGEVPAAGTTGTTGAATGRLVLTLDVGAGSVEVRRAAS